jgi:hypothetical protein
MIPAFLVTRFGKTGAKLVFFGGIALALLLAALTIYLVGRSDGKRGEVVDQLEREVEVQGKVGDANENSSATRVADEVRAERERREINDALEATQDPDRQRAVRGCVILRQQGRDTSRIPACSRSEGRP